VPALSRARSRVVDAYRTRAAGIRRLILARVDELYADVDPGDISGSIDRFIADAEPIITAGQASMATLVAAFVRAYSAAGQGELVEPADDVEEIAGTTRDGSSLAIGMAAFGPMILSQIAGGATVDDAMAFGQHLATRFADSEVTGAADRELEHQAAGADRIVGWEGLVAPGSCNPCLANAGQHGLDEEIYRHPDCNCERIPVLG
jgi:hypothetical protein